MTGTLPRLDADNTPFWTGGADGELRIHRCVACRWWFHPPAPVCPRCRADAAPEPVSGRGSVASFTINRQAWTPDMAEPYVIAVVELVERAGLQFLSRVTGCAPEAVRIGMPVRVAFERRDDVWLPLFTPVAA